jgi:hypothetical protein
VSLEPTLTVQESPTQASLADPIVDLSSRVAATEVDIASLFSADANFSAADALFNSGLIAAQSAITSLTAADAALITRATKLENYNLKIINFLEYGTPDDPLFDNTPALEEALADAYAAGGGIIWFGGGREWWFLTPINSNDEATWAHYDNIYLLGVSPSVTCQHQEAADGVPPETLVDLENTYGTRLRFNLAQGSIWWDQQRPYRFGEIRMASLSFRTEYRNNIFKLGDEGSLLGGSFRGLYVSDCVFSCSPFTQGMGNTWLTLDGSAGYVLPEHQVYAFETCRGYDQVFMNCTFRNWSGAGVKNVHSDAALFFNPRCILCQLCIDVPLNGSDRVASTYFRPYAESSPYYGMVFKGGKISNMRIEKGYDATFSPPIGPYALPAAITWTIATGANAIVFTGGFTSGRDATDYFRPYSVVQVTAPQDPASLPPRLFYINEVQSDRIIFENHDSHCYINTNLSGIGTAVVRRWDVEFIFGGDKNTINGYSVETNEEIAAPTYAYVPSKKTVEIDGNVNTIGTAENNNPTINQPLIIATSAGNLAGGLKVGSGYNAPNHPLAFTDEGPPFHPNWREPIYDVATERQIFLPGRGVGTHSNNSRNLRFHRILDSSLGLAGEYVWCYYLFDDPTASWQRGWRLRPLRRAITATRYTARVYASQATTFGMTGGLLGFNNHVLPAAGWYTIDENNQYGADPYLAANRMENDAHSPLLYATGEFVYVAKVITWHP